MDNVMHACPECPLPGTPVTGLVLPCRFCHNTGLLTEAELYAWQVQKLRENPV
jgi:hypothetical protein